jgi:hypothetical protein
MVQRGYRSSKNVLFSTWACGKRVDPSKVQTYCLFGTPDPLVLGRRIGILIE